MFNYILNFHINMKRKLLPRRSLGWAGLQLQVQIPQLCLGKILNSSNYKCQNTSYDPKFSMMEAKLN